MSQPPRWSAHNPSSGSSGHLPRCDPSGRTRYACVPTLLLLAAVSACRGAWLPSNFSPPEGPRADRFFLRLLTVADAQADYEAVVESRDIIHRALLSDRWPPAEFTVSDDRHEIAWKERQARRRRSFTYAVLSPIGDRILGSVYVNPGIGGPDAAVFLWVRRTAYEEGLDSMLERTTRAWIRSDWPFKWVVFPGRGLPVKRTTASQERQSLVDPLLWEPHLRDRRSPS